MKVVRSPLVRVALTALACLSGMAGAQTAPSSPVPPMRGTVCAHFALNAPDDAQVVTCKGLGKFLSIAELYERGYRVVSSSAATGTAQGVIFIYIEERK